MEMLDESKARSAVVRAMAPMFIIPPQGTRITPSTIDFELIRRNDYDYRPVYRTRLCDGILMGHFIGSADVPRSSFFVLGSEEEVLP